MRRVVIVTVGLVALLLLLRGSEAYAKAIPAITGAFGRLYGALVKGEK